MPPRSLAVGVAAAAVTILSWAAFIVIARAMAYRSLTPADIVACRVAGAALVLLPWGALLAARRRRDGGGTWMGVSPLPGRLTLTLGVPGGVAYALLVYSGFLHAPAAHGAVLVPGMLPFFTAAWSVALLHESLSRTRLAGLAMILAGAALVGGASLLAAFAGGSTWRGDLLFLGAAATWSLYTVLCRRHRVDAVDATVAVTVFAALAYLPAYAAAVASGAADSRLGAAPWGEIAFQAAFQGLGSVVVSGITFMAMVQVFGPLRSTMLTALVPPLAALGAVAALGEPLGWNLVAGLALVTAGIVVGVRGASAPRAG
jgi:drug/metabolite transporter (DMT)-like permease